MDPTTLRYTPTHEWAHLDGDTVTVGITAFAVHELSEPTALELPKVGKPVTAGKAMAVIESVKAASDINAPVSGEVAAVNDALTTDLAPVSDDPYGRGWMVKIRVAPGTTLDGLLTHQDYERQIAQGH